MTDWPKPTFEPLCLACKCGHWWDDWQPVYVPIPTWAAHVKALRCPQCGARKGLLLRSKPLSEKPGR